MYATPNHTSLDSHVPSGGLVSGSPLGTDAKTLRVSAKPPGRTWLERWFFVRKKTSNRIFSNSRDDQAKDGPTGTVGLSEAPSAAINGRKPGLAPIKDNDGKQVSYSCFCGVVGVKKDEKDTSGMDGESTDSCGDTDKDALPRWVGPYKVRRLLGTGSFSKVFLGEIVKQGHAVSQTGPLLAGPLPPKAALKMIPLSLLVSNESLRRSIFLEIKILQYIQFMMRAKHASAEDDRDRRVMKLHAVYIGRHHCTLVCEYIDGEELFNFVSERGRLGEFATSAGTSDARALFEQIRATIEGLHDIGVVHRDLKLENVMVFSGPERDPGAALPPELHVKLIDFGLATLILPPARDASATADEDKENQSANRSASVLAVPVPSTFHSHQCTVQYSQDLLMCTNWRDEWLAFDREVLSVLGDSQPSMHQHRGDPAPVALAHKGGRSPARTNRWKWLGSMFRCKSKTAPAGQASPSDKEAHPQTRSCQEVKEICSANEHTMIPHYLTDGQSVPPANAHLKAMALASSIYLSTRCGSEEYASPELLRGIPYEGRCNDIWSLGIMLYAMVKGSLPFKHPDEGDLSGDSFSGHGTQEPPHLGLLKSICAGVVPWSKMDGKLSLDELKGGNLLQAAAAPREPDQSPVIKPQPSSSTLGISKECKELIGAMLRVIPKERWTMARIKTSAWLNQ